MKKLVHLLLAAAMTVTGVLGVAAQDDDSALGEGIGGSAIYIDERGNHVATLEVTGVEAGWSDYDDRGAPTRGYDFHAVHMVITNESDSPLEVNPSRFSLVDTNGLNNSRKNVRLAETSASDVLSDAANLEAGETLERTLVFELFSDVSPAVFMWQPGGGKLVAVNVSDGSAEESAVAVGLNTPAVFTDERGNVVGSVEVTEVVDGWDEFRERSDPDRGMRYVAVHFTVTNLSDASLEVNPFNLSLLDTESTNNGRSYVSAAETATTQITSDSLDVAPGESFSGMIVYTLFDGVDATALMWQPGYGVIAMVILGESEGDATPEVEDTDVVEDEEEDVVATPAA